MRLDLKLPAGNLDYRRLEPPLHNFRNPERPGRRIEANPVGSIFSSGLDPEVPRPLKIPKQRVVLDLRLLGDA